jgi:glycerol-3-phosphate dehydrogenase (NAD(P)+)
MALNHIAVLGGGAWGTALALTCARAGRSVTLWEHDAANAERLMKKRESVFLPGIALDERIVVAGDLAEAARAEAILLVVPAQAVRAVTQALSPHLAQRTPVIACAKGIERGSKKFMTEVIAECAPKTSPAILSGPSFAADVARGMPTAVTLAAGDGALAGTLAQAVGSATFRPYHSSDVRGVEIGGAAKNVLAIAAGVVTGRGLGASALAALTTRGFTELVRLRRKARDHDGPVRLGRSPFDMLESAIAQFHLRHQARPRRAAGFDSRWARRRRVHGAGAS